MDATRTGRRGLALAIALAATLVLAATARAVDGVPDASFGGDGIVTTNIAAADNSEFGNAVAVQSDGKIVVAGFVDLNPTTGGGNSNFDFTLARYNPDGTLDDGGDGPAGAGFGGDGIVTTDIAAAANDADRIFAMAIQPSDGKIVVAGDSSNPVTGGDLTLARYNTDGSLDSNTDADPGTFFGTTGVVTTPVAPGAGFDVASGVAIQGDGKIVAAGAGDFGGTTDADFALVRYNADGSLDSGFDGDAGNPGGGNGIVATDFSGTGNFDAANAVAIQSDGKIVAAGTADLDAINTDLALARYDSADGKLDTSFDGPGAPGNGKFLTGFGADSEDIRAITIQPSDGKIVVAGAAFLGGVNQFAVVRLLPADGSLDAGFDGDPGNSGGGNGKVTTNFAGTSRATGIAVAPDGKLVAAGAADSDPTAATNTDFGAARYNSLNGTLDTTFAGDGTVTTTVAPGSKADSAGDVAVQADGKVVGVGTANFDTTAAGTDFALVRWGPEPPPVVIPPVIAPTPTAAPPFDLAAAIKKCKKKHRKGSKKRKKCIRKARQRAGQ